LAGGIPVGFNFVAVILSIPRENRPEGKIKPTFRAKNDLATTRGGKLKVPNGFVKANFGDRQGCQIFLDTIHQNIPNFH
jgi:hypothetical protein